MKPIEKKTGKEFAQFLDEAGPGAEQDEAAERGGEIEVGDTPNEEIAGGSAENGAGYVGRQKLGVRLTIIEDEPAGVAHELRHPVERHDRCHGHKGRHNRK